VEAGSRPRRGTRSGPARRSAYRQTAARTRAPAGTAAQPGVPRIPRRDGAAARSRRTRGPGSRRRGSVGRRGESHGRREPAHQARNGQARGQAGQPRVPAPAQLSTAAKRRVEARVLITLVAAKRGELVARQSVGPSPERVPQPPAGGGLVLQRSRRLKHTKEYTSEGIDRQVSRADWGRWWQAAGGRVSVAPTSGPRCVTFRAGV